MLATITQQRASGTDQTDDSRAALFVAPAQCGGPGPQAWSPRPGCLLFCGHDAEAGWVSSVRAEPLGGEKFSDRLSSCDSPIPCRFNSNLSPIILGETPSGSNQEFF